MRLLVPVILMAFCGVAGAQVVYEPVQYQYGRGNLYYYGGTDPRVHARAEHPVSAGRGCGRVNGFVFVSGNVQTHREVVQERVRAFTDALPYLNAGNYGFTAADAQNEANARLPLYFSKADLLAAARPAADGTLRVPSCPVTGGGEIVIRRYVKPAAVARPLILIPRGGVDGPLNAPEPKPATGNPMSCARD